MLYLLPWRILFRLLFTYIILVWDIVLKDNDVAVPFMPYQYCIFAPICSKESVKGKCNELYSYIVPWFWCNSVFIELSSIFVSFCQCVSMSTFKDNDPLFFFDHFYLMWFFVPICMSTLLHYNLKGIQTIFHSSVFGKKCVQLHVFACISHSSLNVLIFTHMEELKDYHAYTPSSSKLWSNALWFVFCVVEISFLFTNVFKHIIVDKWKYSSNHYIKICCIFCEDLLKQFLS